MLVLSRKAGETVVLPTCGVTIQVVEASASRVKLGITAPCEVPVHRGEVARRILLGNEPRSAKSGKPRVRVLIADPEPRRIESYRRVLTGEGYEVWAVTSGVECIERLREGAPDVLILHAGLLWGGTIGVLALMSDSSSGVPSMPVVLHGNQLGNTQAGRQANGQKPRWVDSVPRLLEPLELIVRIRRLLSQAPRVGDSTPDSLQSGDIDTRLADWIKRRTGGRIQELRVERRANQVIVRGCANTYYARQLAQQAASEICNEPETGQREEVVVEIEVV